MHDLSYSFFDALWLLCSFACCFIFDRLVFVFCAPCSICTSSWSWFRRRLENCCRNISQIKSNNRQVARTVADYFFPAILTSFNDVIYICMLFMLYFSSLFSCGPATVPCSERLRRLQLRSLELRRLHFDLHYVLSHYLWTCECVCVSDFLELNCTSHHRLEVIRTNYTNHV